jgi:dihydrofolate synthase/folylpolyglutamate synthase
MGRISAAGERDALVSPPRSHKRSRAFSSYDQALRFLGDRVNIERTRPARVDRDAFKLDRMRALLDALNNPQRDVRCVHVAGSKGKGSVVEMCAAALTGAGYGVGVYTSPHLADVRERVRIGNVMIDPEGFTSAMSRVARAASQMDASVGDPTYFEVMTALALTYFAEQAVDLAVIETGLGGRLDATNLVEPEVTVVTEIQREHTALLGQTLAEIAREKAGIFKPGVPALTVAQPDEAMAALRQAAEAIGAPFGVLGEDIDFTWRFEASPELGPHVRVCVNTARSSFEHIPVPLAGEHQARNCGVALAVLDRLRERGIETSELDVARGLSRTPANGRMEMVWTSPRIMIDGAHNPESIRALVKSIGAHVKFDSMVAIFGCASDKDVEGMLREMSLGADKIIFTQVSDNARAADPKELARRFGEMSPKMVQIAATPKDAINMAARAVGREDLIVVTGSFHLAGEVKRLMLEAGSRQQAG